MRERRILSVLFAAVLSVWAALPAKAAPNSAQRVAAFAKLPDWSGVWFAQGSTTTFDPSGRPPPYNAQWAKEYAERRRTLDAAEDTMVRNCMAGVPRLTASTEPFMIMIAPEQTLIQYSRRELRHIWTDGRKHPPADELWPLTWGESIGHWEGETLVIDTISIKGSLWIDATGARLSDQAHIVERLSRPKPDELRNELTIEDPVALTRPWKVTRTYRLTGAVELSEDMCSSALSQ